ncbi:DUF2993 domain-containing protein [Kribbella shirazensis]|uniref:DUF2993 domain-containing protein n=1 Tax=Kribbella shirazensis TaxID=1105143 RepID=A0A7X5V8Z0_9ACTN|nr:DUF2993 domain-containing protein [Kribbella shirazensis]NIK56814.1 hypothetical protein [Kribbella shirazensis]
MSSRGRGRGLRRLIVTLVVLAVLAVVVDRAAAYVAENQLASMAEKEAAQYDVRASSTSVKIGGFGFLPQLVNENFSKVTLTMDDPTFSGIPGEDLKVDLRDVHVPRSLLTQQSGAVSIATTDLRLQLSPRELGRLAAKSTGLEGLSLAIVDGALRAKVSVRGIDIDVPITPRVMEGRVVLALGELSSSIPSYVRNAVKSQLARGITVPELPFGAQLTGISVVDNSVALTAAVKDLKFDA